MASEIAALRARVKTLESENGKLASTLRKQEIASRTMTESLQSELARVQHLCNELSCTMVLQGVDPSVLSAVTTQHLRFDPAVHQVRATAPGAPSTPRSTQQKDAPAAVGSGSKASSSALEMPFPLSAPAPAALPTAAYQLAPVPAPARSGAQFRGVNATPPEAFIPDSLRKRLDASSALATRLGSPAMFAPNDDQLASTAAVGAAGGERVFLTGAPTTLNAAFDAASDSAHLKPSPPPFKTGEHGAEEGGYDAPTPPRGSSASGRRTHSRGRRIVPSPMNPGLDPQPAGCS